jgi:hypothetical protein
MQRREVACMQIVNILYLILRTKQFYDVYEMMCRINTLILFRFFTNYVLEGKITFIVFLINVCLILLMKRFHIYV